MLTWPVCFRAMEDKSTYQSDQETDSERVACRIKQACPICQKDKRGGDEHLRNPNAPNRSQSFAKDNTIAMQDNPRRCPEHSKQHSNHEHRKHEFLFRITKATLVRSLLHIRPSGGCLLLAHLRPRRMSALGPLLGVNPTPVG